MRISKKSALIPGSTIKIKECDDSTAWITIEDLVVIQYDDGVAQSMSPNVLKNQIG
ncbi:MAG: hypothetical protein WC516_07030 [Patescibacteria group bacterium]|jgi:hypothetical protein